MYETCATHSCSQLFLISHSGCSCYCTLYSLLRGSNLHHGNLHRSRCPANFENLGSNLHHGKRRQSMFAFLHAVCQTQGRQVMGQSARRRPSLSSFFTKRKAEGLPGDRRTKRQKEGLVSCTSTGVVTPRPARHTTSTWHIHCAHFSTLAHLRTHNSIIPATNINLPLWRQTWRKTLLVTMFERGFCIQVASLADKADLYASLQY